MSRFAHRLQRSSSYESFINPVGNPNTAKIGTSTYALTGTNIARDVSQLIRYTRTSTQTVTPTNQYGIEVVVSLSTNQVVSINDRLSSGSTTGTTIPAGYYVLSGHGVGVGYAGQWLLNNATVGAIVSLLTVTVDITNFAAAVTSNTSINLTWSYSGAALTNYTLTRNGTTIASPAAGATSYSDTGLIAGTTYNYTLTGNYSAGGTSNTASASKTTSGGTASLPAKLVGAYWQMYQGPTVAEVTANAPEYNIQYAAFALGNGSGGSATFSPAFQSAASFKVDMAASRAQGCKWLISIGGGVPASSQVYIRNQTEANQLVASLKNIVDEYGFDGIDFDLENGPDGWAPAYMTSVATQLKAHYGSQFIVSIVPRPYESFYYETAVMMGGACDLVQLQFYDNASTQNTTWLRQWIRDKVNEIVNSYGIPASKIVIGCITYYPEYGAGSNTVATYRDAFLEMEGVYPDLRGVFIWESSLDKLKAWNFAKTMGPAVLS